MRVFKELVVEKLTTFATKDVDRLRFFTFSGVEIFDENELDILEHNSYIFVSAGEEFDGKACLGAFRMIRELGEGGFGKVYLMLNKMTKEEVAVKFLKMREHKADTIHKVYTEARALGYLDHPNIVKLKCASPL